MGGLSFVSPDAAMVAAFVVKEPAALADDMLGMLGGTDQSLADGAERFRREHGIDLRHDLAEPLGGEFVFALDGPMLPKPAWKLVVEVYDPARLQATLERLVAEADRAAVEAEHGHVTLETQAAHASAILILDRIPGDPPSAESTAPAASPLPIPIQPATAEERREGPSSPAWKRRTGTPREGLPPGAACQGRRLRSAEPASGAPAARSRSILASAASRSASMSVRLASSTAFGRM